MDAIHFVARNDLVLPLGHYIRQWGQCPIERCNVIVVLGGDGFMLRTLSRYFLLGKPFYGLKFGSVGHLMNPRMAVHQLNVCIETSIAYVYHPFSVKIASPHCDSTDFLAFNDVCVYRKHYQALKLKLSIHEAVVCPLLLGDGVVCASLLGRSGYYASAGGLSFQEPYSLGIAPLNASPRTPWKGKLLLSHEILEIEPLSHKTRPSVLGWDGQDQVLDPNCSKITVGIQENQTVTLLQTLPE